MKCDKCGSSYEIHEHHLHPKFMNNLDGKGKKVWLCRYCHSELHQKIIPFLIWTYVQDYGYNFVSWKTKKNCIDTIKRRTLSWLKEKD